METQPEQHLPAALTPSKVLRWCRATSPELWFPSACALAQNIPREAFDEPLRILREAGLVKIADWVPGQGQGYTITAEGEATQLTGDVVLPVVESPSVDASRFAGLTRLDRGELIRGALMFPRPAIMSPALLLASLLWFFGGLVIALRMGASGSAYMRRGEAEVLLRLGGLHGGELLHGQWWRLITSGFVHAGWIHLAASLFSLGLVGPVAEGLWGRKRFVGLYFFSAFGAACASAALEPNVVTTGASGAVWGLLAAILVWLVRFREHLPPALFQAWLSRLLLMIAVNGALSFLPGVSWQGHLMGAATGVVAGIFLDWTRSGVPRRKVAAGVLGLIALAVGLMGGLVAITHSSEDWKQLRQQKELTLPRVLLDPQFTQKLEALKPAEWQPLQHSVMLALLTRPANGSSPEMLQMTQDCARLHKNLATLEALLPKNLQAEDLRRYLSEVREFKASLEYLLRSPTPPTSADWAKIREQSVQAEATWGRMSRPIDR
jgi:rhomboid protease GluP